MGTNTVSMRRSKRGFNGLNPYAISFELFFGIVFFGVLGGIGCQILFVRKNWFYFPHRLRMERIVLFVTHCGSTLGRGDLMGCCLEMRRLLGSQHVFFFGWGNRQ